MANRCAGLDPTWTHLPAPHSPYAAAGHCHSTSSWLFPAAAAFENEALTCALRASMTPAASSSSYPTTPSSSSTSDLLSAAHDAPAPPARAAVMGPKAGRVTKRKPRPSRRPPITYIAADPANFRRMVQEVTGFPVASPGSGVRVRTAAASEPASAAPSWPAAPACMLPTLDTSAFLLDRAVAAPARGPGEKSSSGGASPAMAVTAVEDDDDSTVLQELEAMACAPADFQTLESWGII